MERLNLDEAIAFCYEKSENIKLKAEPQIFINIAKQLEELKRYKDAKEQGLLLKLPCKVGTEVYEIEQQFWIDRKGCKDCVYFGNDGLGDYCDYCEDEPAACTKIVPREFTMKMLEDFGKTVFLTREEAEQALEQLKAGEK